MTSKLPPVEYQAVNFGCDPEFFFRSNGSIIGAEKILDKGGLSMGDGAKFIIDGVQGELNTFPTTCRALLCSQIQRAFVGLNESLKAKKGMNITADFGRTVEISKEALMDLAEESRKFGCAPSNSIYSNPVGMKLAEVDPTEYRVRAAGGHIHLGSFGRNNKDQIRLDNALKKDYKRTVAMLDLIVGNTCVMLDRDEGNIERRKVYGKAGEYRLPKHGLEYRTLSNFWLTSAPLVSFAFGMARLAVQLMASEHADLYFKTFMSQVKASDVHEAINNNDFNLAASNYQKIEPLILEVLHGSNAFSHPITRDTADAFHHFINTITDKGLNYWFPKDPMQYWIEETGAYNNGFHTFTTNVVIPDMNKTNTTITKAASA